MYVNEIYVIYFYVFQIVSAGIMKHLNIIMRAVNSDRIQYRCCKLIMNLARSPSICSQLISNKVCDLLAPILNGSPSEGTQLVAIRSLKYDNSLFYFLLLK